MKFLNLLSVPALAGLLASACADSDQGSAEVDWQAIEYPLFQDIGTQCSVRTGKVAAERRQGIVEQTTPSAEIHWAADFKEAIERATREDKPIFIASSVRKGGDKGACDV